MSKEANVKKGAFQISRSIFDSDIWSKPPHFLKVWLWLVGMAFHVDTKYLGYNLKRGQYLTSFNETIEAIKWKIGYRYKKNTYDEIRRAYEHLREQGMITTMKATPGIIVTVCNYDFYQDLSNYERQRDARGTPEGRQSNAIPRYKNDKNVKMEEENIYKGLFDFWNQQGITVHKVFPPPSNGKTTIKTAINNLTKAQETEETIQQSILNYKKILNSDEHYFTHRWGLVEFLVRGFYKFNDWNIANNNYLKNTNGKPKTREQRMQELQEMTDKLKAEGKIK